MLSALSELKGELLPALDAFVEASRRLDKSRAVKSLTTALERDIASAFRKQGAVVLEKLGAYKDRYPVAESSYDLSETLSPKEWMIIFGEVSDETLDLFSRPLLKHVQAALKAGGNQVVNSLGISELNFSLANPGAMRYLDLVGGLHIKDINETTRGTIQTLLSKAGEEGWSYDKLAKEIRGRFEEFAIGQPQAHIASRAHLVAVTEIGDAYENAARLAAGDLQAGGLVMEKIWRTAGDGKVSAGCQENAAQGWIPYNQAHASGHMSPLRFPGCRCDEEYRRKE